MISKIILISLTQLPLFANTQRLPDPSLPGNQKFYYENNGDSFYCKKPGHFSFIGHIPANSFGYIKQTFEKRNLYKAGIVAGSTVVLLLLDQKITNAMQRYCLRNNISVKENFSPIIKLKIGGKQTIIGKIPKNINTAFYDLGQGSTNILLAAGFYVMGRLKKDNRALQTASQLTEAFLALGVGTQILKYSTGRENPSDATLSGGRWRPFPSFRNFQNNKAKYDAFPSGHLATFVSAVSIISENYPRKRWIKPVGYSIAALISLSMINNGVHWVSDYPLGIALGYGYGKYIARKNKCKFKTAW
ncbi:MAG: phosphatase PAP2 family protein [Ferruginibacter sp.]